MKTTGRALWLLGGNTSYTYFAEAKLCFRCAWTVFPLCLRCVSIVFELQGLVSQQQLDYLGPGRNWGSGVEVDEGYNTRFLPFWDGPARFCSCKKNYLGILSNTGFSERVLLTANSILMCWLKTNNLGTAPLNIRWVTNTQIHIKTHTNTYTNTQITHLRWWITSEVTNYEFRKWLQTWVELRTVVDKNGCEGGEGTGSMGSQGDRRVTS